ncbi:MAG: XRE family transcriptional regulator [Candidatus Borkfalkiaceae bacterium]|nr:XRE family transcriptional regulator [Christensenellaceae bacterium]
MEIGSKIKALRLQYDLTQEELANRCELTKGYISQLENDLTSPSIATLVDILSALGTTLKDFFAEEQEEKIVFGEDDFNEKDAGAYKLNWLVTNAQKNMMEPILVELAPRRTTEKDVPHDGEEFGYVLTGSVTIWLGNKKYRCNKGESFYYVASKTHYIENPRDTTAKFLWVSCPPNF